MAEGARLESVFTRKGNVGSNPTLSAIFFKQLARLAIRSQSVECQIGHSATGGSHGVRVHIPVTHRGAEDQPPFPDAPDDGDAASQRAFLQVSKPRSRARNSEAAIPSSSHSQIVLTFHPSRRSFRSFAMSRALLPSSFGSQ